MPVKFKCNEPLPLKALKLVKIMILELNTYVLPKTILRTQSYLRKGTYMKKSQDFCFAKSQSRPKSFTCELKKKKKISTRDILVQKVENISACKSEVGDILFLLQSLDVCMNGIQPGLILVIFSSHSES